MALRDLLFTKKKPDRPVSDEPESPIFVMAGRSVRLLPPAAAMTAEIAQRKSPQLYRITNYVASAVQSVPWFCEKDPDVVAMEQAGPAKIKAINDLLKYPNDTFNAKQLQYWIAMNLMLYARAHFKVGVSSSGIPNGIYTLDAKQMSAVLNSRGTVDYYEYGNGLSKQKLLTRRGSELKGGLDAYGAEISFPSLTGQVDYKSSPAAIECIAQPIAIIHALMQRALDTASGHPNVKYVISAEKTLNKKQQEALEKHMAASAPGEDESGQVLFLFNTTIKVDKLDNQLADIHSKIPLDDMTRQIAGVFGVPVPLLSLGSADAAKYAGNYVEARLAFWQDTILPCYLAPIAAGMTQAICPPGARISFDLDAIPALWKGRAELGETLSKVTFLTVTEKRGVLDFEPTTEELDTAKPPVPAPAPALPPARPTKSDEEDTKVIEFQGRS
jgi:Phage portal protein